MGMRTEEHATSPHPPYKICPLYVFRHPPSLPPSPEGGGGGGIIIGVGLHTPVNTNLFIVLQWEVSSFSIGLVLAGLALGVQCCSCRIRISTMFGIC